jgi:hypothetical protein
MLEKEDFKFRDDLCNPEKGDTVPIQITTGPYEGIIYRYTSLKLSEDPEQDQAKLQFGYEILETPTITETTLRKDQRFTNHIGIILNHFILETLETDQNELRENNSSQLDGE